MDTQNYSQRLLRSKGIPWNKWIAQKQSRLSSNISAADVSLLDFVVRINPRYERPKHLAPIIDCLERARKEPIRALIHAPPQHGKTDTIGSAIVWILKQAPETRFAYITYEAHLAWAKSSRFRKWAEQEGVELEPDTRSKEQWATKMGGGLIATGVGGPLTGQPVDIQIIDDPYKNRQQSMSPAYQQMLMDWKRDVADSRLHNGSSQIISHTRWHRHDLIGTMLDEHPGDWRNIVLPAINDSGEALWPLRHSLERLQKIQRDSPSMFEGLYQGRPPVDEGQIFTAPHYVDDWPKIGRVGLGVDLSYSKDKQADRSAIVVLRQTSIPHPDGKVYVWEDCVVRREPLEMFESNMRRIQGKFPGSRFQWSCSSIEKEIANQLKRRGIRLDERTIGTDKLTRNQDVAIAWRQGRILIPSNAEWADDAIPEVVSFTGIPGKPDDITDALADAYRTFQTVPIHSFKHNL
jgi:predicted phage terminase large subunit-like protein